MKNLNFMLKRLDKQEGGEKGKRKRESWKGKEDWEGKGYVESERGRGKER